MAHGLLSRLNGLRLIKGYLCYVELSGSLCMRAFSKVTAGLGVRLLIGLSDLVEEFAVAPGRLA